MLADGNGSRSTTTREQGKETRRCSCRQSSGPAEIRIAIRTTGVGVVLGPRMPDTRAAIEHALPPTASDEDVSPWTVAGVHDHAPREQAMP